jgi:integrase/recombinase XerD
MTADVLDTHRHVYLPRRATRGFQMHEQPRRLPECVASVHAPQPRSPIRAPLALEWACQASTHRGPSGAARRLRMVRGFLRSLHALLPATEVPAPGLLPSPRRPTPCLCPPTQSTALLAAAQTSRPRGSWRPHTLCSVLGLLTSTGLRIGEALR